MPSPSIGGRRARPVHPRPTQASVEQAPDARYVQVEHAGHAPFLTHADEVAASLLGFLVEHAA
jgi:pimeloyl-[acyl-carrier protein] methyl ester esterase